MYTYIISYSDDFRQNSCGFNFVIKELFFNNFPNQTFNNTYERKPFNLTKGFSIIFSKIVVGLILSSSWTFFNYFQNHTARMIFSKMVSNFTVLEGIFETKFQGCFFFRKILSDFFLSCPVPYSLPTGSSANPYGERRKREFDVTEYQKCPLIFSRKKSTLKFGLKNTLLDRQVGGHFWKKSPKSDWHTCNVLCVITH